MNEREYQFGLQNFTSVVKCLGIKFPEGAYLILRPVSFFL